MTPERGLEALRDCVDTIITIPNERLLTIIDRTTSLNDAFCTADDVLLRLVDAARREQIPVTTVTETLVPAGVMRRAGAGLAVASQV